MSDDDRKPRKTGCAILFVPTLIVIDLLGMLVSLAGPYVKVVFTVGLFGLVCGTALGGYHFAKTKLSTNRSLSFWLALGGLVGYSLSIFIAIIIQLQLR
ncbi:MAG: hypothetical protein WCJ35_02860 [Planctomycetota bacterium]